MRPLLTLKCGNCFRHGYLSVPNSERCSLLKVDSTERRSQQRGSQERLVHTLEEHHHCGSLTKPVMLAMPTQTVEVGPVVLVYGKKHRSTCARLKQVRSIAPFIKPIRAYQSGFDLSAYISARGEEVCAFAWGDRIEQFPDFLP